MLIWLKLSTNDLAQTVYYISDYDPVAAKKRKKKKTAFIRVIIQGLISLNGK